MRLRRTKVGADIMSKQEMTRFTEELIYAGCFDLADDLVHNLIDDEPKVEEEEKPCLIHYYGY